MFGFIILAGLLLWVFNCRGNRIQREAFPDAPSPVASNEVPATAVITEPLTLRQKGDQVVQILMEQAKR